MTKSILPPVQRQRKWLPGNPYSLHIKKYYSTSHNSPPIILYCVLILLYYFISIFNAYVFFALCRFVQARPPQCSLFHKHLRCLCFFRIMSVRASTTAAMLIISCCLRLRVFVCAIRLSSYMQNFAEFTFSFLR